MKFGFRTPSLNKRISARLSWKRAIRHRLGIKAPRGMGVFANPRKALYNRIYHRTTFGIEDIASLGHKENNSPYSSNPKTKNNTETNIVNQDAIKSSDSALTATGKNFLKLREQIVNTYNNRIALLRKLSYEKIKLGLLILFHFLSLIFIFGLFIKKIGEVVGKQKEIVEKLKKEVEGAIIKITFINDEQIEKNWSNCVNSFSKLMRSEKIWDLTLSADINNIKERTIAKTSTKRTLINKNIKQDLEFIKSDLSCIFIPNANGPDLFIYPTFLILFKNYRNFGIFDLKEIIQKFELIGYIEEESVPKDAEVAHYAWKRSNKDGSPDKRFRNNYQIPVVKYGKIFFSSNDGLKEAYMFSNSNLFIDFGVSYDTHLSTMGFN